MRNTGLVLALACCCSAAFASERSDLKIGDDYLELEYRAGTGPQSSIVIIDFAATGGVTHAFEYRFEGLRTGHDALVEIAAAGDLDYGFSVFDFGNGPQPYLDNLAFGSEQGNAGLFWSYSEGTHDASASSLAWTAVPVGAGERILTDRSWDGWFNGFGPAPDFAAIAPRVPTVRLPGDYNDDRQVAQEDLDLVLLNWGAAPEIAGWVNQQPTDDGLVDQNDLDDVLLYWGDTLAVGTNLVPEPTAAVLLLLSVLCWGWTRRFS